MECLLSFPNTVLSPCSGTETSFSFESSGTDSPREPYIAPGDSMSTRKPERLSPGSSLASCSFNNRLTIGTLSGSQLPKISNRYLISLFGAVAAVKCLWRQTLHITAAWIPQVSVDSNLTAATARFKSQVWPFSKILTFLVSYISAFTEIIFKKNWIRGLILARLAFLGI